MGTEWGAAHYRRFVHSFGHFCLFVERAPVLSGTPCGNREGSLDTINQRTLYWLPEGSLDVVHQEPQVRR
jgi:hypothetical protein